LTKVIQLQIEQSNAALSPSDIVVKLRTVQAELDDLKRRVAGDSTISLRARQSQQKVRWVGAMALFFAG
jgi:hypothetical protein